MLLAFLLLTQRRFLPVLAPADTPAMPCTIRVAIRQMPPGAHEPPRTGPYEVREVELAEYVVRVLAHEFGDFTDENSMARTYTAEPLRAGAMAITMYAWTHAWHPARPDYDLDNSKSYQVYIPDKPYDQRHVDAVRAVWGTFMVRQGSGELFAPQYGSGWYNERSQGTDWLNQRGSRYLTDKNGYTWEEILRYYYRDIAFRQHARPCVGP